MIQFSLGFSFVNRFLKADAMFKILTLNTISETGLKQFPSTQYHVASDVKNPDAILVRSHAMHDFTFSDSIKVVGRAGVGVNNIPVSKLTAMGIPVLNTVGANANAVRELVLAGLLLASRNICEAWHYVRELKHTDAISMEKQIEQDKKQFVGMELFGKTLGVIGLGSIGVKVANAAMNLGMHVIGYDPTITVNRAWELSSGVEQAQTIEALLKSADFITFHVPLNDATKNMLNAARFSLLKKGVVLLNFARDGIIDNEALAAAIEEKRVGAYVSDFPNLSLRKYKEVISLPHLGASTKEAEENCAVMIVKEVRDFLENGNITSAVNFPTIQMPKNPDSQRIAIVNENIPNVVAQISSKLAALEINISGLMNGSKETIAYTLIDVNAHVDDRLLKEIANLHGIIRVRKLG